MAEAGNYSYTSLFIERERERGREGERKRERERADYWTLSRQSIIRRPEKKTNSSFSSC